MFYGLSFKTAFASKWGINLKGTVRRDHPRFEAGVFKCGVVRKVSTFQWLSDIDHMDILEFL